MRREIIMDEGGGWNVTAIILALLAAVVISVCCGCCNIAVRSEGTHVTCGREHGSPYFCSKHPYYCTAAAAKDCLVAPYHLIKGDYADWGVAMWSAFATVTYPFWVADEVCEIALDTVFFPVDAVWYWGVKEGR